MPKEVPIVVAVHVAPRDITPSRAKMLATLRALARDRGVGAYWEQQQQRGIVLALADPPPAATTTLPRITFVEDGGAVAYVEMLAMVACVALGEVCRATVVRAPTERESVYAEVDDTAGTVVACVSEIHRQRNAVFNKGDSVTVRILDTNVVNKTMFATATCLGV